MAASDLRAIKARLLQLEELERSRKEDERAKKDASRVFGLWNKELSQGLGLSLSDLKQSGAQPRMNQGRWQPQQPPPMLGVPAPKQMKLCLTKFSGKEQYKGLGSGFKEWGKRFLRQVDTRTVQLLDKKILLLRRPCDTFLSITNESATMRLLLHSHSWKNEKG